MVGRNPELAKDPMVEQNLLLLLVLTPFVSAALAATLPVGSRNAETWLAGLTMVIALAILAVLYPAVAEGGRIIGTFDWASLIAALGVQLAFSGILLGLAGPSINTDGGTLALMVLWFALRALLRLAVYIFIGALILQAVLSWINPYSPLTAPAYQLTRPILDPIRRIIPTISGIDLSPLVAILLLQVVLMFL